MTTPVAYTYKKAFLNNAIDVSILCATCAGHRSATPGEAAMIEPVDNSTLETWKAYIDGIFECRDCQNKIYVAHPGISEVLTKLTKAFGEPRKVQINSYLGGGEVVARWDRFEKGVWIYDNRLYLDGGGCFIWDHDGNLIEGSPDVATTTMVDLVHNWQICEALGGATEAFDAELGKLIRYQASR